MKTFAELAADANAYSARVKLVRYRIERLTGKQLLAMRAIANSMCDRAYKIDEADLDGIEKVLDKLLPLAATSLRELEAQPA